MVGRKKAVALDLEFTNSSLSRSGVLSSACRPGGGTRGQGRGAGYSLGPALGRPPRCRCQAAQSLRVMVGLGGRSTSVVLSPPVTPLQPGWRARTWPLPTAPGPPARSLCPVSGPLDPRLWLHEPFAVAAGTQRPVWAS